MIYPNMIEIIIFFLEKLFLFLPSKIYVLGRENNL